MTARPIAIGTPVGIDSAVAGTLIRVDGPEEVLRLLEAGVDGHVLLVSAASATGIAPILPEAQAVVCTSGGPTSHLALVCKEFGIPCLMSASFQEDAFAHEAQSVQLRPDGTLLRNDDTP